MFNNAIKTALNFSLFFFLGMGFNVYVAPFFLIYLLKDVANRKIVLDKNYVIMSTLLLLSLFFVYAIGELNISGEYQLSTLLVSAFYVIFVGYVINRKKEILQKYHLISFYILGVGIKSIIIVAYSALENPVLYGYALLYDPILDKEINSPNVNIALAVFSVFLLIEAMLSKKIIIKAMFLMGLALAIAAAIFTGGRAFFIILGISMVLVFAFDEKNKVFKNIIKITLIVALFGLITIVTTETQTFERQIDTFNDRIDSGISSGRYELYEFGLQQILLHPFGGFTTLSTSDTPYFHNLFLDIAKIGGWIPMLCMLFMMGFVFIKIFSCREMFNIKRKLTVMFICVFILMQQGVIVEGDTRILMVAYLVGIAISMRSVRPLIGV